MKTKMMPILSGIVAASFILSLGYSYNYIMDGQSTLLTNELRALLGIVTSGLSFGYWLGLSIKDKSSDSNIKMFFMGFFGTFCLILSSLLVFQKEFVQLVPLFFAIAMPLLIINSDLIEHERLQFFDKLIRVFSEEMSFPIIVFYLTSSFLELEGTGLIILTTAIIISYFAYKFYLHIKEEIY